MYLLLRYQAACKLGGMRGAFEFVASARMFDVLDHHSSAKLGVVALLGGPRIPLGSPQKLPKFQVFAVPQKNSQKLGQNSKKYGFWGPKNGDFSHLF